MIQYVLVITPSVEISKLVESFYQDFPLYRHSTLPPHLTVLPPFTIEGLSYGKFLDTLIASVKNLPPIDVIFDKVDIFRGRNNLVYFSTSAETTTKIFGLVDMLLKSLDGHLKLPLEKIKPEHFQSHLSLAKHVSSRDLPSIVFEAKKRFLPTRFSCSELSLFQNIGQGWRKVTNIRF